MRFLAGMRANFAAYLLTLAAFLAGAYLPTGHLWGIRVWAHFGHYLPPVLFAIGLLAGLAIWRATRSLSNEATDGDRTNRSYYLWAFLISAGLLAAFILARNRMHFLGDGYTLLSLMASGNPLIIKYREIGESLAHYITFRAVGGETSSAALLSFQIVSIGAGAIFLTVVSLLCAKLMTTFRSRLLLFLGLASSGYMLLFFGYVEYYSLFVVSVMLYCLVGLLIAQKRIHLLWIIVLQLLTIFFHIFGLALIPGTVYLLLSRSRPGKRIGSLNVKTKYLFGFILTLIATIPFTYLYTTDYFFRFALVPIVADHFTCEGYTLFSIKHLMDFLSFLLIMVPGILVIVTTLLTSGSRNIFAGLESKWLLVTLSSALLAVFVIDPKLGMPRDWDMFSYAGAPLAAAAYLCLLNCAAGRKVVTIAALLSVSLGLLVLGPRVAAPIIEDTAVDHFRDYAYRDKIKNRNYRHLLGNYYRDRDDLYSALLERQRWEADFPEERLYVTCDNAYTAGRTAEARNGLYQVIDFNPMNPDAYTLLGLCYIQLQQYDTAITLFRIADGLSPHRVKNLSNLAVAYQYRGDLDEAEKIYRKVISLDTTIAETPYNLARIYKARGQQIEYAQYLRFAASRQTVPDIILKEAIAYFVKTGDLTEAADCYNSHPSIWMDTVFRHQLTTRFPRIIPMLADTVSSPNP